jgi:hypothetical protein
MNDATFVTSVTSVTRFPVRVGPNGGLLSLLSRCRRVRKERGRDSLSLFVNVPAHAQSVTEVTKGPRHTLCSQTASGAHSAYPLGGSECSGERSERPLEILR